MKLGLVSLGKVFSPAVVGKAVQTFDKATMLIVSCCWGGALLLMLFALYTISLSVTARKQAIEAASLEPSLPQMLSKPPEVSEIKPIVDRMQRRFPDISFIFGSEQSLAISATDGAHFRTWLTVLSYIDTVSPQYRWQIKDLCVGAFCPGATPMKAVLTAQKISFSAPVTPSK